jgi:hypothetical protein
MTSSYRLYNLVILYNLTVNDPESESYIMTDGQSARSWNKASIWGLWPDFLFYFQTVAGFFLWALFLTRGRLRRLQLLLALASADIFGSDSHGTRDNNLLSQILDFSFRRLLRLAGLRWRYSTPPSHGSDCNSSQSQVKVMLRLTVSRPVCLGLNTLLGLTIRLSLLSDDCGFVDKGRPLWREDGSVSYNVHYTIYLHYITIHYCNC